MGIVDVLLPGHLDVFCECNFSRREEYAQVYMHGGHLLTFHYIAMIQNYHVAFGMRLL